MKYSALFGKTNKTARELDSINATLLQKAGFIEQTMAGVYTFLHLGLRVLTKIEQTIREEMNTIATEILMPSFSPKELWERTGRIDTIDVLFKASGANKASQEKNSAEYILNSTHEEVLMPLAVQFNRSYKDFPFAVYQIQTKFRNEPRAKSGLLRGREFRMKDAYSFHTSVEDFRTYYEESKDVYINIFNRVGIGDDTHIVLASGGAFTTDFSHEFQTRCDAGEDTIFYDTETGVYYNKELIDDPDNYDKKKYEVFHASEVGNIFPLHTKYSDAFNYRFVDTDGKEKPVIMGCYGIGSSRLMGVIAEKYHDDKGLIWPESIAPYQVHLVGLDLKKDDIKKKAYRLYEKIKKSGIEVLFDDREDASAGQKFTDADLIGIPHRLVVSKRTGNQVEWKKRTQDKSSLIDIDTILNNITLL